MPRFSPFRRLFIPTLACGLLLTACLTLPASSRTEPVVWVDSFRDIAPDTIAPLNAPFPMPEIKRPVFPNRTYNIKDSGAVEGGTVKNTDAIRKAIATATKAGGGHVVVPAGKWLTGPIHLDNNIDLHLEKDAVLLFSQEFADYLPAVFSRHEGIECMKLSPFVYAYGKTNIAITGEGVLDGQGDPWWRMPNQAGGQLLRMVADNVPVKDRIFDGLDGHGYLRTPFCQPIECKNVLIEGVEFRYGAFWTITPVYCENVIIRKVRVETEGEGRHTPNGDGIDPDSCKNVLIEYCDLDTGDDCIAIKAGKDADGLRVNRPMENIVVRYVRGYRGHGGIVCGSETSGGIRNIYGHNCVFDGTDRGLRFKTSRGRGGGVENVWCENILMGTIRIEAIHVISLYTGSGPRLAVRPVDQTTPYMRNMHFKNIQCKKTNGSMILIAGIPEMPVQDITFENLDLGGVRPVTLNDGHNITFKNVKLNPESSPAISILDTWSVLFDNVQVPATMDPAILVTGEDSGDLRIKGGNLAAAAKLANYEDGGTEKMLKLVE